MHQNDNTTAVTTLDLDMRPIIVVGMHRSGTALLARLLAKCGVFMGAKLSNNFESLFFQNLNREIMDIFGCNWSHIDEFPAAKTLQEGIPTILAALGQKIIDGIHADHFGLMAKGPDSAAPRLWGWKDPRNCLTLPIYKQFFPDARIVFIHRDPRGVAISLINRDERSFGKKFQFEQPVATRKFLYYVKLWEEYNLRADSAMQQFRTKVVVSYEDFVKNPADGIVGILNGLGLESPPNPQDLVKDVYSLRADVFAGSEGDRFRHIGLPDTLLDPWGERNTRIHGHEKRLHALQEALANTKKDLDRINKMKLVWKENLAAASKLLHQTQGSLARVRAEASALQAECDRLRGDLGQARTELSAHKGENARLREQLDQGRAESLIHSGERGELQRQLRAAEDKLQESQESFRRLYGEFKSMEDRIRLVKEAGPIKRILYARKMLD